MTTWPTSGTAHVITGRPTCHPYGIIAWTMETLNSDASLVIPMASTCFRSLTRASRSFVTKSRVTTRSPSSSFVVSDAGATAVPSSASARPPPARRFPSFSRSAHLQVRFIWYQICFLWRIFVSFSFCGAPIGPLVWFWRSLAELRCCSGSLFPLHSAVAAARLTSCLSSTSRSCRSLSQGTVCCTYPGV